ncbi:MAG: pyrroline-5-carboxylate reductase [Bacteroidales bacterium]|nr:pyrroline-5-carboxylate reductase [Bacteroidales bacterium]
MKTLCILGGGNLGQSIAKGLALSQNKNFGKIILTRRRTHLIESLKSDLIEISSNNVEAVKKSNVIILAVKPHQVQDILDEISAVIKPDQILISVVTGVEISDIKKIIRAQIYRAMPNTAIAIQESMTCISGQGSLDQDKEVLELFEPLGKCIQINEELMGAATVLGACGIAFALRFLRAATQGGIEIGFSSETSQFIASQTLKGAAKLILENNSHPEQEIDKVTTPMGVTISGLNEMEHQGFSSSLIKGLLTSYHKIKK